MNIPPQVSQSPAFGTDHKPSLTATRKERQDIITKNSLAYGFVDSPTIRALEENNIWKERINAMERIEIQFSQQITHPDKKVIFLQNSSAFLNFLIPFIKDINFKISLASINITCKMLVLDLVIINHK